MRFVQISIKKAEKMRKVRLFALTLAVVTVVASLAGCGYPEGDTVISGKWAYNHAPEKVAFKVNAAEHKAVLDGEHYSCDVDSEFIILKDKAGNEMKLRYNENSRGITLYKFQEYTFEGTPTEGSLTGVWSNTETHWSFEFTDSGEFKEDGYFPGLYFADYEAGTIKLMYNDHFEDTVLYFTIDGNKLIVEYPWKFVRPE